MADLLNSLSPSALTALTLLAKVTLILLAAGLVAAALRQVSAGIRHLVWSAAIVAIVALPLMTVVAPWRLDVGLLPAASLPSRISEPLAGDLTRSIDRSATDSRAVPSVPTGSGLTRESQSSSSTVTAQAIGTGWSLRDKILAVWLLGVVLVAARLALGSFLVSRLVRSATRLDGAEWRRPLVDVADRLELPRLPGLFLSHRLPMPFACGLFRTAIVLPAEASEWTEQRRQAVLCHELAHLRRRDLAINVLAQCALAIYWFHPLMWMAVRRLRIESERACDDLVLGIGTRASEYADHLLQIVRAVPRSAVPVAVLPFAERGEFEGRVLAILERGARRDPASAKGAMTVLALGLVLVAPLAVVAPVRRVALPAEPWPAQFIAPTTHTGTPSVRGTTLAPRPQPVRNPAVVEADTAVSRSLETNRSVKPESSDTGEGRLVVRSLITALADTVASVRENAAYSLGRLRAESAAVPLGRLLEKDQSAEVREMAGWALGNIRSADAVQSLGLAVQRDTSEQVRATAIWALAQTRAPAVLPALVTGLRDRSTEVRGRAAWGLGNLRPDNAPSQLIEATTDSAGSVRVRAAWALGQIRDANAVSALIKLVDDKTGEVRQAAIWALGNMEGDAAQGAMVKLLQSSDAATRSMAARSLGGSRGNPWPWPMPMPR